MSFFSILTNVTKAAVAAVATPVALVVDVVTLPASALIDSNRGPCDRTGRMIDRIGDCVDAATKPEKS